MQIEIRRDTPQDGAAIQRIHTEAFGGPAEAKPVRLVCERDNALISLVASMNATIGGHILFPRVTIANAPETFFFPVRN